MALSGGIAEDGARSRNSPGLSRRWSISAIRRSRPEAAVAAASRRRAKGCRHEVIQLGLKELAKMTPRRRLGRGDPARGDGDRGRRRLIVVVFAAGIVTAQDMGATSSISQKNVCRASCRRSLRREGQPGRAFRSTSPSPVISSGRGRSAAIAACAEQRSRDGPAAIRLEHLSAACNSSIRILRRDQRSSLRRGRESRGDVWAQRGLGVQVTHRSFVASADGASQSSGMSAKAVPAGRRAPGRSPIAGS